MSVVKGYEEVIRQGNVTLSVGGWQESPLTASPAFGHTERPCCGPESLREPPIPILLLFCLLKSIFPPSLIF